MDTFETVAMFGDGVKKVIESVGYGLDLSYRIFTNSVVWSLGISLEFFIDF